MLFYHDKSQSKIVFVMLIEIPDPEIILTIIMAFFGGLFALFISYKINSILKRQVGLDSSYLERLEFYERQLIDMKIRLDSFDVEKIGTKIDVGKEVKQAPERLSRQERYVEKPLLRPEHVRRASNLDYNNTIDYVLGLITDKAMTSRDIQTASQRSREHISRLMKKLYQDGYVERNTKTKPYTYSITNKGKAKLGILEYLQETTA